MIWDYKNAELKRFIQKTFSIGDDVPDTIEEEGRVWVKTRRITSLYRNVKTGVKKVVDNDLYEFEHGGRPGQTIVIDGEDYQWERTLSGFATIADLNGVLKRARDTKFETRFTRPPLDGSDFPYGVT
jgi:hypothetical protein